jgi:hypothetical protein
MKLAQDMSIDEKHFALTELQILIESAVESEQDEPAEFRLETEHRIDLLLVNLRELLGIPSTS